MLFLPLTQILVAFNKRMLAAETVKWEVAFVSAFKCFVSAGVYPGTQGADGVNEVLGVWGMGGGFCLNFHSSSAGGANADSKAQDPCCS